LKHVDVQLTNFVNYFPILLHNSWYYWEKQISWTWKPRYLLYKKNALFKILIWRTFQRNGRNYPLLMSYFRYLMTSQNSVPAYHYTQFLNDFNITKFKIS